MDQSFITQFKQGRQLMNEKKNGKQKNKNDYLKNKDEPTACTHFAAHSGLRHFSINFLQFLNVAKFEILKSCSIFKISPRIFSCDLKMHPSNKCSIAILGLK